MELLLCYLTPGNNAHSGILHTSDSSTLSWTNLGLNELDNLCHERKTAAEFQLLTEGSRQTLTASLCWSDTPDTPFQKCYLVSIFLSD